MNIIALVVFASLINWIVTTILVESTLFAPPRAWVIRRTERVLWKGELYKLPFTFPEGTTQEEIGENIELTHRGPWLKVGQLITCHMCLGTWVGFALAIYLYDQNPFAGVLGVIASGLLYKAGGHFILELRSRLAKVDGPFDAIDLSK